MMPFHFPIDDYAASHTKKACSSIEYGECILTKKEKSEAEKSGRGEFYSTG